MKKEFKAIKFEQNGQIFITSILPFEIIDKLSNVLIYDQDEGGYQRAPEPHHYNKIKKYVLEDENYLLPTSIILGIDESIVNDFLITKSGETHLAVDLNKANKKVFRIVDGQHRIMGLREAARTNPNINNLQLNVIIIQTKPNKRLIEMNIFNEINSKSKRIKVDLIQLAKYEYRMIEQDIKPNEINEHISIQVANLLNEKNKKGVWYNAIKFGIHDEQKIGIIGVNAFRESIKGIVEKYMEMNKSYERLTGPNLIRYSKEAAHNIEEFVGNAWNEIVFNKWDNCFDYKSDIEYDKEIKEYFYNDRYYLQKTLGAKSINYLIGSIVNIHGMQKRALDEFRTIIKRSKVLGSDWEVGKTFSGYSSESAFSKVSKMIKNELPISRD